MAQGGETAGGDDFLRLLHRFNPRRDDSQYPAIQKPADQAVLAFGNADKGCQADVQGGGANECGGIDWHGTVLEIPPDGVVSGASCDARDVRGPRTTNTEGEHRNSLLEA